MISDSRRTGRALATGKQQTRCLLYPGGKGFRFVITQAFERRDVREWAESTTAIVIAAEELHAEALWRGIWLCLVIDWASWQAFVSPDSEII